MISVRGCRSIGRVIVRHEQRPGVHPQHCTNGDHSAYIPGLALVRKQQQDQKFKGICSCVANSSLSELNETLSHKRRKKRKRRRKIRRKRGRRSGKRRRRRRKRRKLHNIVTS